MQRIGLIAFAALLLLPGLGRMGAMDSTDARYLAIAHEMAWSREWLVPRLGGVPHLDKPPLAYWASALGEWLFGAGEFGGRALQQLALLAAALAVASAARRMAGARWSAIAALAFLTAGLPFALSRGVATDLFQLAFVTPALALLHAGATRRSHASVALAFALLGASMLAKGPIGLAVVAAVWLATALVAGGGARLPLAGTLLGLALFASIGLPWFALVADRVPGVLPWLGEQLAGRVTGDGVGHPRDVGYLARAWLLGLLPWTPLVLLALWRLAPRARRRGGERADATDAFLLAWAIAPVLLFSLFPTKLASYVAPALPGAVLALVRAASLGLLDDRPARIALAAGFATTVVAALGAGAAILAESQLGWNTVAGFAVHDRLVVRVFGMALLAGGALGGGFAARVIAQSLPRALAATAVASGFVLAAVFHATAADLPTLREEGRLVGRVPGARLVAFAFQPSLFYYAEPAATVFVAGVEGLLDPFVDRATARRLTLSREEALAMLREDVPTFALIDAWEARDLEELAQTSSLRRTRKYELVANPAALGALAERSVVSR